MPRALLLMLFAALALASCGGGDEREDVEAILDEAFSTKIHSADMSLEAEIRLEGTEELERPVRIEANGPFSTNPGKLPDVDIEIQIGAVGGGQTIRTGVLSTGDRAFVRFQDVFYEQPPEEVARANREMRRNKGRETSLARLGLDPRFWLAEATDEGEAEVAGVETRHVGGALDVGAFLRDFNNFLRKSGSAVAEDDAKPLTQQQIATITESVRNPTFDVYVGKVDGIIRRVSGRLAFQIPKRSRAGLGGVDGGQIEFAIEFAEVNGEHEVEAPADARPLSELTESLGVDAIGDAFGGLVGGGPDGGTDAPGPGSGPSDGAESPDAKDFEAYAACLDEAPPEDTEALQRCSELLHR